MGKPPGKAFHNQVSGAVFYKGSTRFKLISRR